MADIRQLIKEAEELPSQPVGYSLKALAPFAYRPKSQERYDADRRSAYVLSRLSKQYPGGQKFHELPMDLAKQVSEYEDNPGQWEDSYEYASGSHPLYNAAKWAQSLPSAIYATGEMVGNEVDKAIYGALSAEGPSNKVPYPKAYDDYEYAVNTLTGGLTEDLGMLPKNRSYWRDVNEVRAAQEKVPQIGFMPRNSFDGLIAGSMHDNMPQLTEGEQFLTRSGANPTVARYMGPLMDSALNFPSSLGPALNYARAGRPMRALADLAVDYAVSTPHITIPAAVSAFKKVSDPKQSEAR